LKKIKSLLNRILGRENYLRLTSRLFFFSFRQGWLRNNPAYYNHYFVRHLIKPDSTVIDIGANLGYYTVEFNRLVRPSGLVLAVEPIPHYRKVLLRNIRNMPLVKVLPYALGKEEGIISMGLPGRDKHRHGLMKVLSEKEKADVTDSIEVPVKNPATLFAPLEKIDFIKCDIEGYEVPVIPAMMELIEKHRPVLQVETDGENKKILCDLFTAKQYALFFVKQNRLVAYNNPADPLPGDLMLIPNEKMAEYHTLMANA
jgi:FkbM family methyltransferase